MTGSLFRDWLKVFNDKISHMFEKKVLFLTVNCSANGIDDFLPHLSNEEVPFLPPNTTSRLQPLDAGIISALKMHYERRQMERAVDLAVVGINDIYKVDTLFAIRLLQEKWNNINTDMINNCWKASSLLSSLPVITEPILY